MKKVFIINFKSLFDDTTHSLHFDALCIAEAEKFGKQIFASRFRGVC